MKKRKESNFRFDIKITSEENITSYVTVSHPWFFSSGFLSKRCHSVSAIANRVRILCYRNKVCNKKISFMSFYATFSKPKQMTVLGLQGTPDKLGPGRSAKLLAVETIGHLETSLASLLCEIGVGNFWRRGTGGGKKCVFKQRKQQVYNCVIKGEKNRWQEEVW